MSEFVLLADVHGNAPALATVIDREGRDADYVMLGDLHGLMAHPDAVVRLAQEFGQVVLKGNHDHALFDVGEGHVQNDALSRFEYEHTMVGTSDEQKAWMRQLPSLDVRTIDGERICATHAYPWPELATGYEEGNAGVTKGDVPHVASVVSNDYDWVFHAHTHQKYDLDCEQWGHDVHFVNPGSLGYDDTYSVVDTETGTVSHKSVEGEYDREALRRHVGSLLPEDCPSVHEWLE